MYPPPRSSPLPPASCAHTPTWCAVAVAAVNVARQAAPMEQPLDHVVGVVRGCGSELVFVERLVAVRRRTGSRTFLDLVRPGP